MLVLTRKAREGIMIADLIQVVVVRVSPSHVKLGIDAPPNTRIRRGKLIHPPGNGCTPPPPKDPEPSSSTPPPPLPKENNHLGLLAYSH